jgi:hypothetical protein
VYLITVDTDKAAQVTLAGVLADNPLRSVSPLLTLEIGFWDGTECKAIETAETAPRFSAALQRFLFAGTYCVAVSDKRGLSEPVGVVVKVTAPPILAVSGTAGTESFSSTITPSGRATRSFNATTAGTASVTLSSLSPSNANAGIAIGVQDASNCYLSRIVTGPPGGSPQLSVPVEAGFYCMAVFDVGNFTQNQTFTLSVTHP